MPLQHSLSINGLPEAQLWGSFGCNDVRIGFVLTGEGTLKSVIVSGVWRLYLSEEQHDADAGDFVQQQEIRIEMPWEELAKGDDPMPDLLQGLNRAIRGSKVGERRRSATGAAALEAVENAVAREHFPGAKRVDFARERPSRGRRRSA